MAALSLYMDIKNIKGIHNRLKFFYKNSKNVKPLSIFVRCLLFILIFSGVECWAEESRVIQFSIPPSAGDVALNLLANQADVQLMYPYEVVKKINLEGLSGGYTVKTGVEQLLQGTCLDVAFHADRTIQNNEITGVAIMERTDCRRKSFIAGLSAAILGAFSSSDGLAQEIGSSQQAQTKIEEVVVTARRREELLQDVPISVTAISGDTLRQVSITNGADLIKLVPTLSVLQASTGPQSTYSLRGIRTGVLTYFNEVPTATVGIDDQIWDMSSVQALSGPQGTLFGRNSTGGAILFVPQRPTDEFGGYIEGGLGDYDYRQLTGVLNIPVSNMLKVRLGGRITQRDGVVKNDKNAPDFQSRDRDVARLSILFEPTAIISNYTMADYSKQDDVPFAMVASDWTRSAGCLQPAPAACLPGYTRGQIPVLGDAQEARGIRTTSNTDPAYQKSETWGVSNIFTVSLLENLTFKYVAGYRYREHVTESAKANIDLPVQLARHNIFGIDDWSHEFQLLGSLYDDRLNWTAGYFTATEKGRNGVETGLFLPPGTAALTLTNSVSNRIWRDNETEAVFAQATFKLTEKLNLTAGIRYTEDEATQINSRLQPQFTFSGPIVCGLPVGAQGVDFANCERTLSGRWDATTYNLAADYRLSEDLLIYLTSRRGYNGGGFNASIPDSGTPGSPLPAYGPEYITDYEAGLKSDWSISGMPVRTNLSIFHAKYEDIQRQQQGFLESGAPFFGIANGPKAIIQGLQFELVARPIPELTVITNYGYLETEYRTGTNGFSKGNSFAQAPEHTFNIIGTYNRPLAPGGDLVATLSYTYQSEITFQDDQAGSDTAFQKGYGIADARLGWDSVGGGDIDISLFVKNLTDKAYALDRIDLSSIFGYTGTVYNDPRTFGVELQYRFGNGF